MPPELIIDGKMSKAVDVYACGVILWELCVPHAQSSVLGSHTCMVAKSYALGMQFKCQQQYVCTTHM